MGNHRGQLPTSRCQPPPACARTNGQADGLIRLSGHIPARSRDTPSIILPPGAAPTPRGPRYGRLPPSSSPAAAAGHAQTERQAPHRQTPAPAPGPPAPPAGHDPLPGRPHQGRPPDARYASRGPAPALDPAHPPAEDGSYQGQGADIGTPKPGQLTPNKPRLNHPHRRPIQVRRTLVRVAARAHRPRCAVQGVPVGRRHRLRWSGLSALPCRLRCPAI